MQKNHFSKYLIKNFKNIFHFSFAWSDYQQLTKEDFSAAQNGLLLYINIGIKKMEKATPSPPQYQSRTYYDRTSAPTFAAN
jgi:hypothetical protein